MASITITMPTSGKPTSSGLSENKVWFQSEDGKVIRVPFAPTDMTIDNLAPVYAVIERPDRMELLVREREQLPVVSMTLVIAQEDQSRRPNGSVEDWITKFRKLISTKRRWKFTYGDQVGKDWWRFTEASLTVAARNEQNAITQATIDVQLTRDSSITVRVGPVTSGPYVIESRTDKKFQTYTVRGPSDTLWNIAYATLGNGERWVELMEYNDITDPRLIVVGQIIKIPPR